MTKEYFLRWLKAAGIRAVRTMAQTAIATIGVEAVIYDVDWLVVFGTTSIAGLLSLLTSIASVTGLPEVKENKE